MSTKLIVIVAPSGAGKSTLITRLMQDYPNLKWSVSCTTRPSREGEVNGKDYHFIERDDFIKRRDADEFVEWATVHSNFYGTSKLFLRESLEKGESVLLDLDVQGADSMKKAFPEESVTIFIEPPSLEELKKRLLNRGTESIEVIEERVSNAEKELEKKDEYDHIVLNDDVDRAYQDLKDIMISHLGESN